MKMARRCGSVSLLSIMSFLVSCFVPSDSSLDSFVFGGCTQQKYTPKSPYEFNLDSLLTSLVNTATYSSYNKFTIMGSSPQYVVYGLFQCRGDLSMPDCAQCVARAVTQVGSVCSQTCGGSVQLQGCFVKYDNTSFLGVEDKTVVLKKCGPSVGYDTESMGLRDAVLGSLASGGGLYRVGGSGKVQGIVQCVGDLSMGQCQDCVSEAIGKLKNDCGTAVYGDMFLAKCYARYTTVGPQAYSSGGGGGGSGGSSNGKPTDKGVKTFAIIVGLLGVVAILIIFLTFIRKIFGGGGK